MAKAKLKKTGKSTKKLSSNNKRNLFIFGALLVCVGILLFALQLQQSAPPPVSSETYESVGSNEATALGPSQGCNLIGTDYVCDIKINNPKDSPLEWSSLITGIDGASVSNGGFGNVEPNGSTIVQLTVPKAFCDTNPEGEGSIMILEDQKSSNQAETQFACSPIAAVSEASSN